MALLALVSHSPAQSISLTPTYCTGTTPCVVTYHNDNSRDGVNPRETTLTPSYLSTHTFSATTIATDGLIYAQPLYIHGLSVSGTCSGSTNMVFVATENDTVYAINAANGTVCWHHHFITGAFPEKPIPYTDPTLTDCTTSGTHSIVQCFEAVAFDNNKSTNGIWSEPAFWNAGGSNEYLYGVGLHDYMYWYPYVAGSPGAFNPAAAVQSDWQFAKQGTFGISVGGTVSVTWDGSNASHGVVWAFDSNGYGREHTDTNNNVTFIGSNPAILFAYPAVPGGSNPVTKLWDSSTAGLSGSMPGAVKFMMPTVADGYIFVAGGSPGYFSSASTSCPAPPPLGTSYSCAGQLTILH